MSICLSNTVLFISILHDGPDLTRPQSNPKPGALGTRGRQDGLDQSGCGGQRSCTHFILVSVAIIVLEQAGTSIEQDRTCNEKTSFETSQAGICDMSRLYFGIRDAEATVIRD